MPTITRRYVHEISKDGALFFLLNGFNGALNRLASQIGGGLQAIALALSTPQDNSTEVQKKLDELAASLTLAATEQEEALKPFNKPREN